jgi:hypothetical protein
VTTLRVRRKYDLANAWSTVDDCAEREEVEGLIEDLPNIGAAVFPHNLLVEAVSA